MPKYTVSTTQMVRHNGKNYSMGQTVEMSEEDAARLPKLLAKVEEAVEPTTLAEAATDALARGANPADEAKVDETKADEAKVDETKADETKKPKRGN